MDARDVTTRIFIETMLKYAFSAGESFIPLVEYEQELTVNWKEYRQKGWLEEQDELWADRPIERRQAARIVHEFLRIQFGETEVRDWNPAKGIKDLYHCRACARHIAQVYLKGIMDLQNDGRFGLLKRVTDAEMTDIFERAFDLQKRKTREIKNVKK